MFEDEENSETGLHTMDRRIPTLGGRGQDDEGSEQGDMALVNDYSDYKEALSVWIQKPDVVFFIRKKFGMFLRNYVDENDQHVYEGRIQDMCQNNKQSIEVNFTHLSDK
jgi:spore maturation protein CgeB